MPPKIAAIIANLSPRGSFTGVALSLDETCPAATTRRPGSNATRRSEITFTSRRID
jgi:hypothetical protein